MQLSEKAAYLKGLIDGLGIDTSTKEGKVILAMGELLEEMTIVIKEIDDDVSQLYDDVEIIEDEMVALEEDLYDDDDIDDEDDLDDEDADYDYEITCTKCGAVNLADEDVMFSGEDLYCANCNEVLDFAYDAEDATSDEE